MCFKNQGIFTLTRIYYSNKLCMINYTLVWIQLHLNALYKVNNLALNLTSIKEIESKMLSTKIIFITLCFSFFAGNNGMFTPLEIDNHPCQPENLKVNTV